ncbi:MAG: hypothetical protein U0Y08_05885 [Bacteroidia bacterium]
MKKHLLSLFFVLALLIPAGLMAQSGEAAKGKHGGYLVTNDQKIYFEIVDDGSNVTFYPCDQKGEAIANPPAQVDITIASIAQDRTSVMKEVQLTNGTYTVTPERVYPVLIYGLNYTYNNEQGAVKFRNPDAPKPR